MKEKVRANGNQATMYDVNIHTHTLFCMVLALQGVLIHPQMLNSES